MPDDSIDEKLYQPTVSALKQNGVPSDVAEEASKVIASDADRTVEQQRVVDRALIYYSDWQHGDV